MFYMFYNEHLFPSFDSAPSPLRVVVVPGSILITFILHNLAPEYMDPI